MLTQQNQELTWPLFLRDPTKRSFSYRLTYTLASGSTSSTPWLTTDAGKIDISDPFPAKSTLMIVPAVDWSSTSEVLVHVAYPDNDNPVTQQNYIFTSANSAAQTFVADRQDPSQTSVYYEARIIDAKGAVWTVPGSVTTDGFLTIQPNMKGHQIVTIRPEAVDFASVHVNEVDVQLRYNDTKNTIATAKSFKLVAQSDVQRFAYDYLDPSVTAEYRADVQLDNGQTKSLDWTPVAKNTVTLGLSQLA